LPSIITLELDSESHVTMPKVIERHPFRNLIRHVDFLKISLDEATTAEVAVELVGDAPGTVEGGVLTQVANTLSISALPMVIPSSIEVDVSGLNLNDSLRLEELPEIEGVEFLDDPETVIATVAIPRAVVEEPTGEEAAEGEEGVEGEEAGAEGTSDEAAEESSED
jgi:large subunit ribosomal protein L25